MCSWGTGRPTAGPTGRLRSWDGTPLFSGARSVWVGRQHDTVCQRTPVPRHRRHGHRPAQTPGGRRHPGVPCRGPKRVVGRRRRPVVWRPGRKPRCRRTRRAVRGTGPVQLSVAPARARPTRRRLGPPIGRRSAARSCSFQANPIRSRRSTCCALRSRDSADRPSSSPTQGSATGSCPCSTTCSIASPRSSPSTHGLHLLPPCPDPRLPLSCAAPGGWRLLSPAGPEPVAAGEPQPTAPQPVVSLRPRPCPRSMRSPRRSGRKEPHCAS